MCGSSERLLVPTLQPAATDPAAHYAAASIGHLDSEQGASTPTVRGADECAKSFCGEDPPPGSGVRLLLEHLPPPWRSVKAGFNTTAPGMLCAPPLPPPLQPAWRWEESDLCHCLLYFLFTISIH
eukprot:superscaffoldBa00010609_g24797